MKAKQGSIRKVMGTFANIATSVVSGLPRDKYLLKPENKVIIHNKKETFKPDDEKHYHRPIAKPVVEKQTLLKESKKKKAVL